MNQFLCFHLVWGSLASTTACICLGMLLIRFLQTSFVLSLIPPSLTPRPMCTSRRDLTTLSPCLGCYHRYSIGHWQVAMQTISRYWPWSVGTILRHSWGCVWGHYSGARLADPQNATIAGNLSWRMLMCNLPSILPSILHIWPTPWGVAQPQNTANPPPKLTVPPPCWSFSQVQALFIPRLSHLTPSYSL